jgi:transketolase
VGEDGPTHQPIEHLLSLRAIPNLAVFRPSDAIETAECWDLALKRNDGPSLLALSRQNLPCLRDDATMKSARGGYRLIAAKAPRQVVLIATGSEVSLAAETAEKLESAGIGVDVVSMPCTQFFDAQSAEYRDDILPRNALRVSIEAGVTLGWERYVGDDGLMFGIDRFGASGRIDQLYDYFGLTADNIISKINAKLAI